MHGYRFFPISERVEKYLIKHQIKDDFEAQKTLFMTNPKAKSLNIEKMEPKGLNQYSFRITGKYRAVFIYRNDNFIEVLKATNHYQD